jgi:phosphoribosylglycinamide formyltransferase 1
VVMASGNGTNFQALLDAARSGALPLDITAVVCNNPSAYAIERARHAGIAVRSITWDRNAEDRHAFDLRLLEAVTSENPELVVLLGWMHLLAKPFVESFAELLNLHPAFLPLDPERDDVVLPDGTRMPAFRGPRAVHDALATSSGWVGATVHRVTPATDRGPVLVRKPLLVKKGEAEEVLMERVHAIERPLVLGGVARWLYERKSRPFNETGEPAFDDSRGGSG